MQKLLQEIRRCSLCESLPLGPKPLLQGSRDARILIAGQAPGRRAHESGVPFDDRSGDRLRDWLGIDRDAFYDASRIAIMPIGFCYPGSGERGDLPPRPECARTWRRRLLDTLGEVHLTVLVGIHAQRWHLRERCGRTMAETVARWRSFWPSAVPLPHPSPRNAHWLQAHPDVAAEIVPALRLRVQEILAED